MSSLFFLAKFNQRFVHLLFFLKNQLLVLMILMISIASLFSMSQVFNVLFYVLRFIIYFFLFHFVFIYFSFSGLCKLVTQLCPTLCNRLDCTCQAPLSLGFPRQEYQSRQPFPSPGDLLCPGIESGYPASQADSLLSKPPGNPISSVQSLSRVRLFATP